MANRPLFPRLNLAPRYVIDGQFRIEESRCIPVGKRSLKCRRCMIHEKSKIGFATALSETPELQ